MMTSIPGYWPARLRLTLYHTFLVDTLGWVGRWLPIAILSYGMWFSLTGVRILIVPGQTAPHTMSDPDGPGFRTPDDYTVEVEP